MLACMTQLPRDESGLSEATDAELARRVWSGSGAPDAEQELCRRLMPRVRLFGLRHLRDPDAAAELTQQVMALALVKLRAREVTRPESIVSFVLGAARNAARDLQRVEERWRRQQWVDAAVEIPDERAPEPLDTERLQQCLAALVERERTVILLTFYDHLSAPQIAGRLGLSGGNVRVIRSRALERLRACMSVAREDER